MVLPKGNGSGCIVHNSRIQYTVTSRLTRYSTFEYSDIGIVVSHNFRITIRIAYELLVRRHLKARHTACISVTRSVHAVFLLCEHLCSVSLLRLYFAVFCAIFVFWDYILLSFIMSPKKMSANDGSDKKGMMSLDKKWMMSLDKKHEIIEKHEQGVRGVDLSRQYERSTSMRVATTR